ncbi:hypothetical protein TNCV_3650061 [Trichonephila clavipes]|nr:hypothetical protein TNCV_3650061 [Trichonephila clavipes]
MSSGRYLPQINLGVQGGIQGDSHSSIIFGEVESNSNIKNNLWKRRSGFYGEEGCQGVGAKYRATESARKHDAFCMGSVYGAIIMKIMGRNGCNVLALVQFGSMRNVLSFRG